MTACKCKPYGKARGMCTVRRKFDRGELVEVRNVFDGKWYAGYQVRREWRTFPRWGNRHLVEVRHAVGRPIGGHTRPEDVRRVRPTTPWAPWIKP